MGGPKGRRRVEQGFLGAEHFLQPDGKLKKQTRKRVGLTGMKVRSATFSVHNTCTSMINAHHTRKDVDGGFALLS
jgi:hypothetical protein